MGHSDTRETKAFKQRVREVEVEFTLAEIQAAGAVTSLAKEFGQIPADAIVLYTLLDRVVAVTDGAAGTFDLDVGDGTTDNLILDNGDVDGGTTKVLAASDALADGGTFTATLKGSVNLDTVTAGNFKLKVRFIA